MSQCGPGNSGDLGGVEEGGSKLKPLDPRWVATLDWSDKLIQSEQVGGRAHEPKRICFVWRGGDAAYRNGALSLSRATLSADGVGSLKCYDKGGIEKAC